MISALLTAGTIGVYFETVANNSSSNGTNVVTIPNGSTETITTFVTVTDTAEINSLRQEVSSLQNKIDRLNQTVTSLRPVTVFGTVAVTGIFNAPQSISFTSQGITYTVTVANGGYQIYLPKGNLYQVSVHGSGWFWLGWDQAPLQNTLDLTSNPPQLVRLDCAIHR